MRKNSGIQTLASLAALLLALAPLGCKKAPPGTYETPEAAVADLESLIGTGDAARRDVMFGPDSGDVFQSGDPDEDRRAGAKVKELIAQKVAFEEVDADTRVALFGEKAWPFPIPLVRQENRWRFDTAKGRDELINRRVGYNELSTLESLHEYVDAQREYAAEGRDGNPPAFAQKFLSTPGKHDGLYWEAAEGEAESPLGDLLGEADPKAREDGERTPFNGYYYKILTAQGASAPGGARPLLNSKGLLTGGFGAVAWPAKYGSSGVMTFQVNERGVVYEKDLGAETESVAAAIEAFDPGDGWTTTSDSLASVADESAAADEDD